MPVNTTIASATTLHNIFWPTGSKPDETLHGGYVIYKPFHLANCVANLEVESKTGEEERLAKILPQRAKDDRRRQSPTLESCNGIKTSFNSKLDTETHSNL